MVETWVGSIPTALPITMGMKVKSWDEASEFEATKAQFNRSLRRMEISVVLGWLVKVVALVPSEAGKICLGRSDGKEATLVVVVGEGAASVSIAVADRTVGFEEELVLDDEDGWGAMTNEEVSTKAGILDKIWGRQIDQSVINVRDPLEHIERYGKLTQPWTQTV